MRQKRSRKALKLWNESSDKGVKHFSGKGTYSKSYTLGAKTRGAQYVLNLGSVKEIADVTLNRKPVGIGWMAPFKLDITKALKPGK